MASFLSDRFANVLGWTLTAVLVPSRSWRLKKISVFVLAGEGDLLRDELPAADGCNPPVAASASRDILSTFT